MGCPDERFDPCVHATYVVAAADAALYAAKQCGKNCVRTAWERLEETPLTVRG